MIPQRFPEANTVMVRPQGWTEEEFSDIHAFVGDGWVITAWRPTPAELMKLNLGEPVYLMLKGGTMQPACVTADSPFVPDPVQDRQLDELQDSHL
jgi:hypothetical protein